MIELTFDATRRRLAKPRALQSLPSPVMVRVTILSAI